MRICLIGARQLTVPPLGELRKQGMGPYGPAYVGTPDEVIKMIEEELKVCPMTQIVFSIDSPGMDPRHMKRLDGTIRKGSHTSFPKSMSRGWNPSAPARVLAFFESLVSRSLDHQNETKLIAPSACVAPLQSLRSSSVIAGSRIRLTPLRPKIPGIERVTPNLGLKTPIGTTACSSRARSPS